VRGRFVRCLALVALLAGFAEAARGGARLELATDPPGADAWGNERYLGRTPLAVEIDAGALFLRLAEASESLWVAPAVDTLLHAADGETLRIALGLGRSYFIRSHPAGLPIERNGRGLGKTPVELRLHLNELEGLRLLTPQGAVPVPPESLATRGGWRWEEDPRANGGAEKKGGSTWRRVGRYVAPAVAAGCAIGALIVENEADQSYDRYRGELDPSRIAHYYDETRNRDDLSTALWVSAEVALASAIVAWILPEREGKPEPTATLDAHGARPSDEAGPDPVPGAREALLARGRSKERGAE
jgi:hypothetical protein